MALEWDGELEVVETWVGANGRNLRLQAKDMNGDVYDLSDLDSASVSATLAGTYKISEKAVAIEVGTDGWLNFTPTAGEIDEEGDYMAMVQTVEGGLFDYLGPVIIRVRDPIFEAGS